MDIQGKAERIELLSFKSVPMRAFHVTWLAFFLSFFAWFAIAPLMAVVRQDLNLSKEQVGNIVIASVAATILVRLVMGALCDRIGPRKAYAWLLILGAFPVMGIGLARDYETFLFFRLIIGGIGASFVITQYHTSLMFAPNCVGTANATTAGWGNAGGGAAQMLMPLLLAGLLSLGVSSRLGWRLAMIAPGILLLLCGLTYARLTKDTPQGNFSDLRGHPSLSSGSKGAFGMAARDPRVWALFAAYGACFGVELTVHNVASLYFIDRFGASLKTAGLLAGSFGVLALFARSLGGWLGDKAGGRRGLRGRAEFLGAVLLIEGILLAVFSRMPSLALAAVALLVFGLFVHMSAGATYALVPFLNKRATGSVAGIVGAGGNAGAVAAGFLFRAGGLSTADALLALGAAVCIASLSAFAIRFSPETETQAAGGLRGATLIDLAPPTGAGR